MNNKLQLNEIEHMLKTMFDVMIDKDEDEFLYRRVLTLYKGMFDIYMEMQYDFEEEDQFDDVFNHEVLSLN